MVPHVPVWDLRVSACGICGGERRRRKGQLHPAGVRVMSWAAGSEVLKWPLQMNAFGSLVFGVDEKKKHPTGEFSGKQATKTWKRVYMFLKACLVF